MNVGVVKSENKKPSVMESLAGISAGGATYAVSKNLLGKPYGQHIIRQLTSLSKEDNETLWRAANKAFETSPLVNKKVKIVDLNSQNFATFKDDVIKKIAKPINNDSWLGKILKNLQSKQIKKLGRSLEAISKGENACYIPLTKTVALNRKRMAFSTFHELGHSINHASRGFVGKLHESRKYFALLAPIILAVSLLKNKKAENEKPKNVFDKVDTFTKENCGKLMFACMVPTLAEEGLASINANKLAKETLKPDLLKKMNKLNFKAWTTYLAGAAIMGACGALAVWIKDRVAQPELARK